MHLPRLHRLVGRIGGFLGRALPTYLPAYLAARSEQSAIVPWGRIVPKCLIARALYRGRHAVNGAESRRTDAPGS